jgi:cysteinyl-tRNA synthetase
VHAALDEDFNTPGALALLFRARPEARDTAAEVLEVLGLGSLARDEPPPPEVVALAQERLDARARRDFAASDRLRDQIAGLGWEVRDGAAGFELYPHDG